MSYISIYLSQWGENGVSMQTIKQKVYSSLCSGLISLLDGVLLVYSWQQSCLCIIYLEEHLATFALNFNQDLVCNADENLV